MVADAHVSIPSNDVESSKRDYFPRKKSHIHGCTKPPIKKLGDEVLGKLEKLETKNGKVRGGQGIKAKLIDPKLTRNQFLEGELVMSTMKQISRPTYEFHCIHRCYLFFESVANLMLAKDPVDDKANVHWMTQ